MILRHTLESKRNSNTGRLVARAIEGCSITEYGNPGASLDTGALDQEDTWLLYPNGSSRTPKRPPKRLVVLDGSWGQARRMAQRIPSLWRMPTLALPPPMEPLPRLRTGAKLEQMSTAESVIAALRHLGHSAPADHLEGLLRELVRRFSLPQRRGPQARKISPASPPHHAK